MSIFTKQTYLRFNLISLLFNLRLRHTVYRVQRLALQSVKQLKYYIFRNIYGSISPWNV